MRRNESKWSGNRYSFFWAERVNSPKAHGLLPYFVSNLAHHPLLPIDISEANYLLPPPEIHLTTTDLIAPELLRYRKDRQLASCKTKSIMPRVQALFASKKKHAPQLSRTLDFKAPGTWFLSETQQRKGTHRKCAHDTLDHYVLLETRRRLTWLLN